MNKISLSSIGFLSALGVVVYCGLISGLFRILEESLLTTTPFWAMILILTLLVFSAALMGLVVFGYPVYLIINKRIKDALILLSHTFLFLLGLILLGLFIIALV